MLLACTTDTKKDTNQDSYAVICNEKAGIHGVAIADGIGSHYRAELGAAFATRKLKELLEACTSAADIDMKRFFKTVQRELVKHAQEHEELEFDQLDPKNSLGTTLLCLLWLKDEYLLAYVGNGAILYIDGQFSQFGAEYIIPWNIVNLLNPHTVPQNGAPTLYSYIGLSIEDPVPTVIRMSRDHTPAGEIMAVMTDGIASAESGLAGREPSGKSLWIKAEERLPLLYQRLAAFLKENPEEATAGDLQFTLEQFLADIRENGYMNDDATIAVLIPEKTIGFHQHLYEQQQSLTTIPEHAGH